MEKVIKNIIDKAKTLNVSSLHFNFLKKPEYLNKSNNKLLLRQGIQFHWKNKQKPDFRAQKNVQKLQNHWKTSKNLIL